MRGAGRVEGDQVAFDWFQNELGNTFGLFENFVKISKRTQTVERGTDVVGPRSDNSFLPEVKNMFKMDQKRVYGKKK